MTAFINHAPIIAVYIAIAALTIGLVVRFPILWVVGFIFALWCEGK